MTDDDLIQAAAAELNDPGHRRWSIGFLETALVGAKQALAMAVPDVTRTTETVTLTEGSHQRIPGDGIRLIEVKHNVQGNGSPGRAVRFANRKLLDRFDPQWRSRDASARIEQYTWDEQQPMEFETVPPAQEGVKVSVVYARNPSEVPVDDVFDQYTDALRLWMLAQAHRLNTSEAAVGRARDYESAFYQALGMKAEARALQSRPQQQRPVSDGSN